MFLCLYALVPIAEVMWFLDYLEAMYSSMLHFHIIFQRLNIGITIIETVPVRRMLLRLVLPESIIHNGILDFTGSRLPLLLLQIPLP